jgi:excinuclease UvrABC nuclease subunit
MELPIERYNSKGQKTITNFDIPEDSGVYFIFDKDNNLIYVGSSTNIRRRIAQHQGIGITITRMVKPEDIDKVSFIITNNYICLEEDFIKAFKPKYNISPFFQDYYNYHTWRNNEYFN